MGLCVALCCQEINQGHITLHKEYAYAHICNQRISALQHKQLRQRSILVNLRIQGYSPPDPVTY